MKKILVLTDFSENSVNAYRYAVQLACSVQANILLVFSSDGAPMPLTNQLQFSQRLHSFAKRYACDSRQKTNPHNTECLISSDKWPEAVSNLINYHHPDLVIAGSGMLNQICGENNIIHLQAFEYSPVLWVPDQVDYQPLRHLVFATDFTDQEPDVVERIKCFAPLFNAHISAVHFYPPTHRNRLAELKKGGEDLDWAMGGTHSKYFLVEEEDMIEGSQDFADKLEPYPVNLFILGTQDTHLVKQYLQPVYQKTQAYHLSIPLLTIYQEKKKACSGSCNYCQSTEKLALEGA